MRSPKNPSHRVQHQRVLIEFMRSARLFWQLLRCCVFRQQLLLPLLRLSIWSLSACLLGKLFFMRLRALLLRLLLLLLALSESSPLQGGSRLPRLSRQLPVLWCL